MSWNKYFRIGLGVLGGVGLATMAVAAFIGEKEEKKREQRKIKQSKLFFEKDADLFALTDLTMAVVGYGNQGRAQALNLKDSNVKVIVGNRNDHYKEQAEKDGLKVMEIPEAVAAADVVFILTPDETMPELYEKFIAPNLKDGATLCFASGYNIAYKLIVPRPEINVIMIAPRMIGKGVRDRFKTGEGYLSYVCVHQDHSGNTKEIMLALAKALGTLKKSAIECSMMEETLLDLFMEQAWVPSFNRVMVQSINTLIDWGLPPAAVLTEIYMSEELAFTAREMAKLGLVVQTNLHSHTSQYGTWSRTKRYTNFGKGLKKEYEKVLKELESGSFAKEWTSEKGKRRFRLLKDHAMNQEVMKIENQVRTDLGMKSHIREFYSPPDDLEELKKDPELKKDLDDFVESLL